MERSNPVAATQHRIAVLVVDGVSLIDLATASELLADSCRDGSVYDFVVCSPDGKDVTTRSGLPLPVAANAHDAGPVDTVIVLGADDQLHRGPAPEHLSAARHLAGRARRLASMGSGSFVLGAAGLLHGRRATTHRQYADLLQELHPSAEIVPEAHVVTDGNLVTSAGEYAARTLALTLLTQDRGEETRHSAGRGPMPDRRLPGADGTHAAGTHAAGTVTALVHPLVRKLTLQIVADPCAQNSLSDLAAKAAVSPRHLSRLFQEELRTTPARFVEQVRFDTARRLLDGGLSVTDTAFMSGFGSLEAQRRAFISRLGVSPRAYQRRFKSARPAPPSEETGAHRSAPGPHHPRTHHSERSAVPG